MVINIILIDNDDIGLSNSDLRGFSLAATGTGII